MYQIATQVTHFLYAKLLMSSQRAACWEATNGNFQTAILKYRLNPALALAQVYRAGWDSLDHRVHSLFLKKAMMYASFHKLMKYDF